MIFHNYLDQKFNYFAAKRFTKFKKKNVKSSINSILVPKLCRKKKKAIKKRKYTHSEKIKAILIKKNEKIQENIKTKWTF